MHKQIALLTERDNEDAWVEGDTQLLERALSNLVGNAIEYSPVNSEVRVSLQLAGGELVVSIRDQGPGMDQNSINRLLSDQYKKSTARSEKTVGRSRYGAKSYGLGLSFVYTVINRHGGRIIIQSEPDIGTEFKLYFSKIDP